MVKFTTIYFNAHIILLAADVSQVLSSLNEMGLESSLETYLQEDVVLFKTVQSKPRKLSSLRPPLLQDMALKSFDPTPVSTRPTSSAKRDNLGLLKDSNCTGHIAKHRREVQQAAEDW